MLNSQPSKNAQAWEQLRTNGSYYLIFPSLSRLCDADIVDKGGVTKKKKAFKFGMYPGVACSNLKCLEYISSRPTSILGKTSHQSSLHGNELEIIHRNRWFGDSEAWHFMDLLVWSVHCGLFLKSKPHRDPGYWLLVCKYRQTIFSRDMLHKIGLKFQSDFWWYCQCESPGPVPGPICVR